VQLSEHGESLKSRRQEMIKRSSAVTKCFVHRNINPLKPSGHYMYHQFNIHKFLHSAQTLHLCILYGCEKKQRLCAALRLVFITEMESVYCAVRTGSLN